MEQITMNDAELVGGSGILVWVAQQIASQVIEGVWGLVRSGQVDYAGVAESQGTYYNTVGA